MVGGFRAPFGTKKKRERENKKAATQAKKVEAKAKAKAKEAARKKELADAKKEAADAKKEKKQAEKALEKKEAAFNKWVKRHEDSDIAARHKSLKGSKKGPLRDAQLEELMKEWQDTFSKDALPPSLQKTLDAEVGTKSTKTYTVRHQGCILQPGFALIFP